MTKINATKDEFAKLYNGLVSVKELKGKRFALLASKNMSIIRDALQHIEDLNTPSEEFVEVAQKITALVQENKEGAEQKVKDIEEANAEIIQSRKDQLAKVTEALKEDIELELHKISEDILPESINTEQINNIIKIIE
tara:strand:+ start:82 stop:495 length:414 start_codon:yes stop_codon:yes gene_type:complete